MKKFMMKYLMVNCKEATMLMAKREEGKLSFMERINLSIHTSMCSFCKKFEKQTDLIRRESKHIHLEENLSEMTRNNIERVIREHSI
jgi:hypothetical protein